MGIAAVCIAIALVGLVFVLAGDPKVLLYAYPAGAFILGVSLYMASRPLYVGFALWVWFLTPFVRRIVDYEIGAYTESSTVMLAPYLVSLIAVLGLWAVLKDGVPQVRRGLLYVFAGLAFGSLIGLVLYSPVAVAFSLIDWVAPLLTATLILADWKQYPRYRDVVMTTVVAAMAVLGLYGIYQYVVLPPWDLLWMSSADMNSIGKAIPMDFRPFGTLNAPGPFAMTLMVGLLALLAAGGRGAVFNVMARLAAVPAVLALALTQVRTAWGGLVIGVCYILLRTGARSRRAILMYLVVAVIAAIPFFAYSSLTAGVEERAGTLGNLEEDGSYEARTQLYANAPAFVAARPLGMGVGLMSATGGGIDSGILTLLVVLGIPGALLYSLGVWALFWWAFKVVRDGSTGDRFSVVAAGVAFAMLSTILFSNQFAGLKGTYLWGFLAFALAATRYYSAQQTRAQLRPSS